MSYAPADRPPLLEEGLRDEVLERWHAQGLARGTDLSKQFHYDRRERIEPNVWPRPALKRPCVCREDLAELRRAMDSAHASRLPANWPERVEAWRHREHILELTLHPGLFLAMGVEAWRELEPVLYLMEDEPVLVREVLDVWGHLSAELAERVLRDVQVDFASFNEPIAGNSGPLVSPAMYREFALASYRPILDVLRRHGVQTICLITYANAAALLPAAIEAGFNCLWACEASGAEMDCVALRRRFGRNLRLIGGIDLDALVQGPAAIDAELEHIAPLLDDGGYVPLADGRVRSGVSWPNYVYYRQRLLDRVQPRSGGS